ncbi:hypothetical protein TRIUR3_33139 [Triticum urartu]|uniref:Uncharacterized protein n=1 Tax=Triticum urartu TaxID=4572 RepID=M7ZI15_TRIUA|nr:hypothetical protein TRIUR3_33139 [Triticum urartu]
MDIRPMIAESNRSKALRPIQPSVLTNLSTSTCLLETLGLSMESKQKEQNHLADLCGAEHHTGSQLLHDITPCFRLALDAANIAIVEAVAGHRVIHLVDFDINAPQHAALIQRLADRRVPGTCLQVTAVTDPTSPFTQSLAATLPGVGERLKKLAERAGIEYHFRMISCRAAEIEASKLGCEPGEALAVNLAFALSHVPDESVSPANPRDELLRRVRALGPQVVTLVEQELNSNTAPLATRFSDAYLHYGAILDALDSTVMARAGAPPPGLVVNQENGVLRLGWKQRVVAVASAWR